MDEWNVKRILDDKIKIILLLTILEFELKHSDNFLMKIQTHFFELFKYYFETIISYLLITLDYYVETSKSDLSGSKSILGSWRRPFDSGNHLWMNE